MVWPDSYPELSVPCNFDGKLLKVISIEHTSLIAVLTSTSVIIYDQISLLPVTHHKRSDDSLLNQGHNVDIKTKHISVDTASLQQVGVANLFIRTDADCLIIYQMSIASHRPLYELYHEETDETIQSGLPLAATAQKFSVISFLRNAATAIINGNEVLPNLEDVEHQNNLLIDDKVDNDRIPSVKLAIYKILKVGIGLSEYWLKSNSHTLLVFSYSHSDVQKNSSQTNIEESSQSPETTEEPESFLQLVNLKTFKTHVIQLSKVESYNSKLRFTHVSYNTYGNYILGINENNELWHLSFKTENGEPTLNCLKLHQFDKILKLKNLKFAADSNLVSFLFEDSLKLGKVYVNQSTISFIKDISHDFKNGNLIIQWSPDGSFFVIIDRSSKYWVIFSKFGNKMYDSLAKFQETSNSQNVDDHILDFLRVSSILIIPNSLRLLLVNKDGNMMYSLPLLRSLSDNHIIDGDNGLLFLTENYIHMYTCLVKGKYEKFKFPLTSKFKNILKRFEWTSDSEYTTKTKNSMFHVSQNEYSQFSISYANTLAVSTPYTNGLGINHILWFNLRNYLVDPYNIFFHFWMDDYLIIFNRTEDIEGAISDEVIVLDTPMSKFGASGVDFKFDNDKELWRHGFKSKFVAYEVINDENKSYLKENAIGGCFLVILTEDYDIIVLRLLLYASGSLVKQKLAQADPHLAEGEDYERAQYSRLFLTVSRKIHLNVIRNRFSTNNVIQIFMIQNRHFLLLFDNGDLYLLKNLSVTQDKQNEPVSLLKQSSHMYDFIKICEGIESFQVQHISLDVEKVAYLCLLGGNKILVYSMYEMIDFAFNDPGETSDGIDEEFYQNAKPVTIETTDFSPLFIKSFNKETSENTLDLIGIENTTFRKSGHLVLFNKVKRKLMLNDFIEHDLINKQEVGTILRKYKSFSNFYYCLEMLVSAYVTSNETEMLSKLFQLVNDSDRPNMVYVNSLRKIEAEYWVQFFKTLDVTPIDFMDRLIELNDVELCYNFLIVYLNYKKQNDDPTPPVSLDSHDTTIILKIIKMLDQSRKYEWCFELCRFIKLLEPSGSFLKQVRSSLQ
ncbi:Piso0_003946 [Millerozyma farinosa CBS 7064]|uniref:Piso0_003946 protein n=1 Tax=Pichia sorbitophila (strain ATCC MYA-4447 / BCRC 22081 / CBS 7064 / NBRC 10061 / NRRL Y-12695) TaxID=559304 RepID=G8Y9Y8_PICSO|nr:Piso0_003946 [Millerozyma farinosa CBS 7064]CCE84402.1 Piso0_003946 [Millerozyma farinosa CBS 7064]